MTSRENRKKRKIIAASYRDDQRGDSAGEAGEQPADVKHPHVLCRDDDGEAEDVRQRAEHQTELPADLLHHPAAQQAAGRRAQSHDGLTTQKETLLSNERDEGKSQRAK